MDVLPVMKYLATLFIKIIILITSFFTYSYQSLFSQEWLISHIFENGGLEKKYPFLSDPFYDEITYGKIDRTLDYFSLNGSVKSAKAISFNINADTISGIKNKTELFFNQNRQLIKQIEGDTSKIATWSIEKFFYNNQKLSHRKSINAKYSDIYRTTYRYDDLGYLIEKVDSFKGRLSSENQLFHYTTSFFYNKTHTTVHYKFASITKVLRDLKDGKVNLEFDEKGNYMNPSVEQITYDSLNRPIHYFINNGCGANSALCIHVSTKFDSKGNIINQIVNDVTIRNALWSFSSHYEAEYDENNLLIRKKYFRSNSEYNEFFLQESLEKEKSENFTTETYAYTFDNQKNWIKLKVYSGGKLTNIIERKIKYFK